MLKLSDFDYFLPRELIAQYPLVKRDNARLLVLNRAKAIIEHRVFKDITNYLKKDDLLILNDTKVLPSRLVGNKITGGRVEVLLLRRKNSITFDALISPGRTKINEEIFFNGKGIRGTVCSKNEISFKKNDADRIYEFGVMPLPPYIKRKAEDLDNVYYQTVYARKEGAIASPTAGLHFTEELLRKIKDLGVNIAYITLHVGIGTFQPVKCEDVIRHKMEPEYFRIPENSIKQIEKAKKNKSRIIAIGSTSLRTLETYALGKKEGDTDLFIYPGFKFKLIDCLLTNFHLPRTTLFILVCAFAGEKLVKKAYQEAIDKKYRFYSYGDAMLII